MEDLASMWELGRSTVLVTRERPMLRWVLSVVLAFSVLSCDPVEPDPDEGEETPDAGDVGAPDAGGTDPNPICRATLSGAVTAVIDCQASTSAEYARLSRTNVDPIVTTFGLSVPSAAKANGLQVSITVQYADAPVAGQVRTQADVTSAMVAVGRHVDGSVDRQWTASKHFGESADQGTFSLTLSAMREDAVTQPLTIWQPTGTFTAHAPVYPGYEGSDAVDIAITFRPRSP